MARWIAPRLALAAWGWYDLGMTTNWTPEVDPKIALRYSDAQMQSDLDNLDNAAPGPANRARHLLLLDTPARRARADAEGHTLTNLLGGRPSERVYDAVRELLDNIRNGKETKELAGERTARIYREQEAEKVAFNNMIGYRSSNRHL